MKKIIKNLSVFLLFFTFALGIHLFSDCSISKVSAYPGSVSSSTIHQSNLSKSSLTISWSPSSDTAKYRLFIRAYEDYSKDYTYAGETTGTTFTFKNLKAGTEYNVRIFSVNPESEENYGITKNELFTLPGTVTGFRQKQWWYWINSVDLTWDKQSGVDGYELSLYNSSGKRIKRVKASGFSSQAGFRKVSKQVYTAKIRAFKKINGKTYYGPTSKAYCFCQAQISSAKVTGNKLNLKWKKVSGATGYDIYLSTKMRSGYKRVKSVSSKTTSCTITKFNRTKISPRKKYYVYVETKKKVGSKTYRSGALYSWVASKASYSKYFYLN